MWPCGCRCGRKREKYFFRYFFYCCSWRCATGTLQYTHIITTRMWLWCAFLRVRRVHIGTVRCREHAVNHVRISSDNEETKKSKKRKRKIKRRWKRWNKFIVQSLVLPLFRHLINESKTPCALQTMHERMKRISEFVDASVDLSLSPHAAVSVIWMGLKFEPNVRISRSRLVCVQIFFIYALSAMSAPNKPRRISSPLVSPFSWVVLNFNSLFSARVCRPMSRREMKVRKTKPRTDDSRDVQDKFEINEQEPEKPKVNFNRIAMLHHIWCEFCASLYACGANPVFLCALIFI